MSEERPGITDMQHSRGGSKVDEQQPPCGVREPHKVFITAPSGSGSIMHCNGRHHDGAIPVTVDEAGTVRSLVGAVLHRPGLQSGPADLGESVATETRAARPLVGEDYNVCNQVYRDLSEQQARMLATVLEVLEPRDPMSLFAYGCGFGVFERAFVAAVPVETVSFTGVDVNQIALDTLATHLSGTPRVVGYDLYCADLTAAVSDCSADLGLSVHSLYRITPDQMTALVRRMYDQHQQSIIALDPRTKFWAPFIDHMVRHEGTQPLFADDLETCLRDIGIPATRTDIDSQVVLDDVSDTETLRKHLSFLTYEVIAPDTTSKELLETAETMGGVLQDRRLTIPNPSAIFAF